MHDWKEIARQRLELRDLPSAEREEVVREIAAHLEECYDRARLEDLDDEAAIERALREVQDWDALGSDICKAKLEGNPMNKMTKTIWLPAIAILFAVGLTLVLLDRAAVLQRVIWIACMGLLLCAAASEASRLNQRTKSFWLPGFISLTAFGVFLLVVDMAYGYSPFCDSSLFFDLSLFLQLRLGLQDLVRRNLGSARSFYLLWLLAQVGFGALGAFFSSRMGGSRKARIIAGVLPALVIVAAYFVVLVPATSFISLRGFALPLAGYIVSALAVWMVAPAMAAFIGAWPFLREADPTRADVVNSLRG